MSDQTQPVITRDMMAAQRILELLIPLSKQETERVMAWVKSVMDEQYDAR